MLTQLPLIFRLTFFWIFTLVVAISLAVLLNGIYRQGADAQISLASKSTETACWELQKKFLWGVQNNSFEQKKENQFQSALLEIILDHYTGVEGGFWNDKQDFTAYAFPTYEGSGIKQDVPEAEKPLLKEVASSALKKNDFQTSVRTGQREALIITACPIEGASVETVAWTMTRVPIGVGTAYDNFVWGLGLLLAFVIVTGIASSILLMNWLKNLRALEASIKNHSIENLPELPATKEVELNSIVNALNQFNTRLRDAKAESGRLSRKLAQAERLSALGKMAAGIAHEIRNPLATMRLKLENMMVAPEERLGTAIPVIVDQMNRMDRLVQMMLAMTQPFELKAQNVDLASWFQNSFLSLQQKAQTQGITLQFESSVDTWSFDPFHMARALENILLNAIAFSPSGSAIVVSSHALNSNLVITVRDSGPGISEEVRKNLFEPFATKRPHGTGLGLTLVREIIEAHGGTVKEVGSPQGACFEIEVPWLKS